MVLNKRVLAFRLTGVMFVAVWLYGCSSVNIPRSGTSVVQALRVEKKENETFQSLRATGTIAVESPSFSNTASIDVSMHSPDSLRIKITGPFGITVGELFATSEHYIVYNALENTILRGALAPDSALPLPGFTLTFDDAYSFLRGQPPALDALDKQAARDTSATDVKIQDENGRDIECIFDGKYIRGAHITQASGGQLQEFFSAYTKIDSMYFPKHLTATSANRGTLSIRYDDIKINTTDLDFSIPTPASARILSAH